MLLTHSRVSIDNALNEDDEDNNYEDNDICDPSDDQRKKGRLTCHDVSYHNTKVIILKRLTKVVSQYHFHNSSAF